MSLFSRILYNTNFIATKLSPPKLWGKREAMILRMITLMFGRALLTCLTITVIQIPKVYTISKTEASSIILVNLFKY